MWFFILLLILLSCPSEGFVLSRPINSRDTTLSKFVKTTAAPLVSTTSRVLTTMTLKASTASTTEKIEDTDFVAVLRDTIVTTSDSVWDTVEAKLAENAGAPSSQLEQVGNFLMEWEESLRGKPASPTSAYLETLSLTPKSESVLAAKEDKIDTIEISEIATVSADKVVVEMVTPTATVSVTAPKVTIEPTVIEEPEKKSFDLQRPQQIQGLFENLQKQAISSYRSIVGADTAVPETAAISTQPIVMGTSSASVEAELESLLMSTDMKPIELSEEGRAKLIAAIQGLEDTYKPATSPITDRELSGHWSLVYSSSGAIFKGALGKKRSMFFKVSDPQQSIDIKTGKIMNSATLRLRFTPFKARLTQEGTYQEASTQDGRTVMVDFARGKFGKLNIFRKGSVAASCTFLSEKWRVCRSEGSVLAFRKIEQ